MDALTAQAALVDQVEREKANEIKDKAKGASFFFSLTKSRTKRKVHLDDDVLVCSQYCKCEKSCTAHGHTRTMKSHTHTHTHTHTQVGIPSSWNNVLQKPNNDEKREKTFW
jgi:hypothetical protein